MILIDRIISIAIRYDYYYKTITWYNYNLNDIWFISTEILIGI